MLVARQDAANPRRAIQTPGPDFGPDSSGSAANCSQTQGLRQQVSNGQRRVRDGQRARGPRAHGYQRTAQLYGVWHIWAAEARGRRRAGAPGAVPMAAALRVDGARHQARLQAAARVAMQRAAWRMVKRLMQVADAAASDLRAASLAHGPHLWWRLGGLRAASRPGSPIAVNVRAAGMGG